MRLRPRRRPWWPALLAALTSLVTATALLTLEPAPATAVVTHELGHRGTVLGFTSWYGSYGMGSLGRGWCIDHGSHSPDPDFGYVRTSLPTTPVGTRTAMAWVAARWGTTTDPTAASAVMLALHDLMEARYPFGPLVVEHLGPGELAGFGADEAAVRARARTIKADALAHAGWRGPVTIDAAVVRNAASGRLTLWIAVRDAAGHGVPGVVVQRSVPPSWRVPSTLTTGGDGTVTRPLPADASGRILVKAVVPDLVPDVWRSSSRPAQRIIRPATTTVTARAAVPAPPPPTTSTTTTTAPPTSTTSTTSVPTTTSTTVALTTTTTLAPSTTTTTIAAAAVPTTTAPPSTTAPAPPPTTAPTTPPIVEAAPSLPRTGTAPLGLGLSGLGLALLGLALVDLEARAVGQDGRRGAPGRRA